jgi:large subunit ribosomal protein L6
MSRIGRTPIKIPANVEVGIDGNLVTVKGPKGELSRTIHSEMLLTIEEGEAKVSRPSDGKQHRELHGLTRTLVANMVEGVTNGFEKVLEIQGVGYRAAKEGNKTTLRVGYSHPVEFVDGDGITIEVPAPNRIVVKGIDKEAVGEVAANIRAVRKPEPYKGKGIRYAGERVVRKAGKTGKK